MKFTLKSIAVMGLAMSLASPVLAGQAPGVGPNGENGGFTAKFIDAGGIRTRYYEEGKGETMVLVHGSGFAGTASANTWTPVLAQLAQRFHVYAPDKLASGMTDNPKTDADLNIRGEVAHMVSFIKAIGGGPVHLVGQSRGGGLTFLLASNHPELVKTHVIIDSATASPPAGDDRNNRRESLMEHCPQEPATALWPCQQAALQYDRTTVTQDFVDAATFMENLPKAQETDKRMTREVSRANGRITSEMNHDAYHRILTDSILQMPTLLYWGKNDPSVLPIQAESLFNIIAETNPHARLLYINRGGHFHWREHPDEFAHTIISFIDYWTSPSGQKELATGKPERREPSARVQGAP